MVAVLQQLGSVHEDVADADGELVRFFEGGFVRDGRGIKDDDIGEVAILEQTAAVESEVTGGQTCEAADRFFDRYHFFFADVFAQESCEVSVGTRVRVRLQKVTFGCDRFRVGAE